MVGLYCRPALARHHGRLRHRIGDHRLLRLRRARDSGQHGCRMAVRRDLPEFRRQVAALHEGPGTGELGRVEPAARDQDVVVVVVRIHDDVGAGIGDPEQIRAGDRLEPGLALEDDQLRGGGRDEELGRRAPQRRLRLALAAPFKQIDQPLLGELGGDLVDGRRRLRRHFPGAAEGIGQHPSVIEVEIDMAARVIEDEGAGIDHPLIGAARYGAQHRDRHGPAPEPRACS